MAEFISLLDDDNDLMNEQDRIDEAAAVKMIEDSPSSSGGDDSVQLGPSSDDEDMPLAARAAARGSNAATMNAVAPGKNQAKEAPAPEKKAADQQEKKKRTKDAVDAPDSSDEGSRKKPRFAAVKKGSKCGKCDNCLNPHWKKACIEARKAQESAAGVNGVMVKSTKAPEPAVAVAKQPVKKPASAATPAPAAATASTSFNTNAKPLSSTRFAEVLGKIITSAGGIVQPSHVPVLIDLMKRANTWGQRTSILHAMVKSIHDVLKELVHQKGLLILQRWFSEAVEGKRPTSLASLLTALENLPVSVAALSPPCELGKLVGNLRKAPEELDALKPQAAALVAKWKAIVKQGDASVSLEKAASAAATATAKASAAAAETKAATSRAASAATDSLRQQQKTKSSSAATTTATTTSKLAAPPASSSLSRALGDDVDIFGAADKRRAGAAAVSRKPGDAPSAAAKTLTTTTTTTINAASAATTTSNARRPILGANKGPSSKIQKPSDSTTSQSTSSSLLPSVSVSSLSSLGGVGGGSTSSGLGGITSSFGSHHMPLMMTAADRARQRAKEAAARVPSPEPGPRKEKKKKLVWKDVSELEAVRWFRKSDPPAAAKADVDDSAPPAVDTREPSPPRFASAAKNEHLSEAHALKAHREEEDQFRAEIIERLRALVTDIEWYDPPVIAAAAATAGGAAIATGEQSFEIAAAKARRSGPYAGTFAGFHPTEPHGADRGRPQPLHSIPRIPLSIEEAQLWAAQAQQQQQQQQQQHRRGPPPPQQGYYRSGPVAGGPGAAVPHHQHHHQPNHHYGPPPAAAGPPQPMLPMAGPTPVPAAAGAALPEGISAAIAQLAASGALPSPTPAPAAAPPHVRHQPPPQHKAHRQQQQQQQRLPPPRQQPRVPVLPPGMRPMLGLHRPAQPPTAPTSATETTAPGTTAAPPQQPPPTQPNLPTNNVFSGIGGGSGGGRPRPLCRFFQSAEGCRAGTSCRFAHLP